MSIEEKALEIINNWPSTKVEYGNGKLKETGALVKEFGRKALIVIGQGSVKRNGYLETLQKSLDKVEITYDLFEGVEPNPSKETVEQIAEKWKNFKADFAIGLGGGSAMDAAKAAAILVTLDEDDISPYFGVQQATEALRGKSLVPCICIPTTSGTSAEVTKYSNVTVDALGVKKLIVDTAIIPPLAIVDPELTLSCPAQLTATVGLDTLTHSMEGYLNCVHDEGNEDANERALISIELITKYLLKAVKDGNDLTAREMMSRACVLGGTVIVHKSTGGPHMNSFSWYDVMPHGQATGVMLPYYTVYYAKNPKVAEKLEPIAEMFGLEKDDQSGLKVGEAMLKWYEDMGFKTKLSDYEGFTEEMVNKAVKDAAENAMKLKAMPQPIPEDRKNEILKTIIEGAKDGELKKIAEL